MMSSPEATRRFAAIASADWTDVSHATRFWSTGWGSVRELLQRRHLLRLLVGREIKARYKNSSLGVVWSLFRPVSQLLVYYFAVGQVLGVADSVPDFAIFVFTGLITWTLFTEQVGRGVSAIVDNSGLVKKVSLPREVFPVSATGSALFNFCIQLGILLVATLVLSAFPLHAGIWRAVPALAIVLLFGTALSFALGALNVYFRDIEHIVDVVLVIMFWASPIVYSYLFVSNAIGGTVLEQIYLANPVTIAILGMQDAFWLAGTDAGAIPADLDLRMVICVVAGLIALWIGQRVFAKLQGNFAQEL